MTLSDVIQNEEYWYRRLAAQWLSYRRARGRDRAYHRDYVRRIIANIRQWHSICERWPATV